MASFLMFASLQGSPVMSPISSHPEDVVQNNCFEIVVKIFKNTCDRINILLKLQLMELIF